MNALNKKRQNNYQVTGKRYSSIQAGFHLSTNVTMVSSYDASTVYDTVVGDEP